jgi:23S rRNA (uracil1939-C5)-methyltransferase
MSEVSWSEFFSVPLSALRDSVVEDMDEKKIKIEKVVFGGKGLSRDLQKVTFVPLTLPGETILARIIKEHSDFQEAEAISVVEPSPYRVAPDCEYFGICGGCQMSHATYDKQIEIKLQILEETLHRNLIEFPPIEVHKGKPFAYRHRAQLKYDSVNRKLGFYAASSNTVVDIQECLCLTPALNQQLKSLRSLLCTQSIHGIRKIECYDNGENQTAVFFDGAASASILEQFPQFQSQGLTISFRGFQYPMNPKIFLQVNPGMWRTMVLEVEGHYAGKHLSSALELYCGAGFFTAPLAAHFDTITACEENEEAIRFAKENHKPENIKWIRAKAEDYAFPRDLDAVIVDPPRSGLHQKVQKQILECKPSYITYVSCDCTTFARDLKKLKPLYNAKSLTMMDLFPQTFHFEMIALLEKKKKS